MKYEKLTWTQIRKTYPNTLGYAMFTFGYAAVIAFIHLAMNPSDFMLAVFYTWGGYFCGRMCQSALCEKQHTASYLRKILDGEIEKAKLIIEAEAIVAGHKFDD